jgi:hypothetical protein
MSYDQTHSRSAEKNHYIANLIKRRLAALSSLKNLPLFAAFCGTSLLDKRIEEPCKEETWRDGIDANAMTSSFKRSLVAKCQLKPSNREVRLDLRLWSVRPQRVWLRYSRSFLLPLESSLAMSAGENGQMLGHSLTD